MSYKFNPFSGTLDSRYTVGVGDTADKPAVTEKGGIFYTNTAGAELFEVYDGSGWKVVSSGVPYNPLATTDVRYVDVTNGSDAAGVTGFLSNSPLRSIGRALELINADANGDGSLIKVAAGVYQETLPLRIKKNNVSIVGDSMRSCFVHPTVATENNDMFEVDSGSYIANLTLTGLKVPVADQGTRNNSLDNDATYGLPSNQPFAVRFRTDINPVIIKSPYIQNCTHFSDAHFDNANFDPNTFASTDSETYSSVAGDKSSAPCGGGLLIDGSQPSSSSPLRSMVVDSFTQITLDGPGVLVTNNGYAQLVSFFGTFAHYHAKARDGGQINLSNCVSNFGRYGLISDGHSPSPIASATISAPSVGAGSGSSTVTIGAITSDPSFHGTVTRPLDHMMITIDSVDYGVVSSVANGAGWDVTLSAPLSGNITSTTANFALRSYISTGGHTFEFVGSGTDYNALPDNGGVAVEANQVTELNGGKVWQSSTDHIGKFKAGSVFVVDQVADTATITGTAAVTGNLNVTGNIAVGGTTINPNAEVNVQADWNETNSSSDAFIQNKPAVGAGSVTSITAGNGLTGGTITTSGTIALDGAPSGALVGTTDTQTLTNKTLGDLKETIYAITDGTSVDLDPSNGPIQTWTLGANRTATATNFAAGESMLVMVDDGSSRTLTWPTMTWVGGSAPTLAASGYTVVELWKVGSTLYGAYVGDA